MARKQLEQKLSEVTSFVKTYLGIDASKRPIPVAPTCHYMMGGIPTDAQGRVLADGKTQRLPGLYAAGECACVSVHGANRLGTNSLVDLVVFGKRAGVDIGNLRERKRSAAIACKRRSISSPTKIDMLLEFSGEESASANSRGNAENHDATVQRIPRQANSDRKHLKKFAQLKTRFRNVGLTSQGKAFNYELEDAFELEQHAEPG